MIVVVAMIMVDAARTNTESCQTSCKVGGGEEARHAVQSTQRTTITANNWSFVCEHGWRSYLKVCGHHHIVLTFSKWKQTKKNTYQSASAKM